MRPIWLLESDAYGSTIEPLKTEIRRQGMTYGVIRHEPFTSGYQDRVGDHVLQDNDCVIFIGTWPLWRHIQLHWSSWTPGGWCSKENLDCAVYYEKFARYLLNRRHTIMTGIEAIQRQTELFAAFSKNGSVFVRPSGCLKVFNGRCVDSANFSNAIAPARYDPATQIVVAEPKEIGREWRFVIAEHRPIAASQYYDAGVKHIAPGCPSKVWHFVETVLADATWDPEEIFILDVCESNDELWVIELNGFSCAGLYQCDLSKIVAKARECAERAWNAKFATV